MDDWRTKFRVPPLRLEHVERTRLVDRLNHGLAAKLTLISAPAGFGKTTLLGEWLQRVDRPSAWVSLDADDDAWPRFLASCLTGLQGLDPGFGSGLLGALESPPLPAYDGVLAALPRELASFRRPFVLVLDDFHVISDAQVHDLLTFLIDNQPPGMHLVLAGRADPPWPLARLRAAGAIHEVRAEDLRFTAEETHALLNDTLGLDLSREDLTSLEERTEGWVAGLHLAALSLKDSEDRHRFIQAFAGSDRFVLDYLMEEVLARQPPEIAEFLLQTSVLDRFNADLCDALTGRSDSQTVLRRLEAGNLFVVPLDHERRWFTYHSLMRSFLRAVQRQRDPDGTAGLHRRAMTWYEANGDILDAIQHGMRAGAHEQLGHLIRSNALALVFQGELSTVLAWLHDSRETWPRMGPWLRIAQLWAHSFSGDEAHVGEEAEEARALIEEGLHALEDEPDAARTTELRHALAHLTAIEANLAVIDGRHAEAARLAQRAVTDLPASDSITRRYSYVCLGMSLRQLGELSAAVEALTHADESGGATPSVPAPARGLATRAGIQIWLGQLEEAETTCRRILGLHDAYLRRCGRRPPIAAFGYARLSDILRERNRVEEAVSLAQESRALAERWQQTDALFESYTHLARALSASGDADSAAALLHKLEQILRDRSPWLHAMTLMEDARLCLTRAQDPSCLDRARSWAQQHPLPGDGQLVFRDHPRYLTHARLLLHEAQQDRRRAQAGLDLTRRVIKLLEPTGALGLILHASILCALFEAAGGDADQALQRVIACLRQAEPHGYVRLFLDQGTALGALLSRVPASEPSHVYAEVLLQASASRPLTAPSVPVRGLPAIEEPLSERELEVLRLLASTLSSAQIADELCVATSTVRSHTKAIYGKLGVHTRLEAIDAARELGVI